MKTKKLAASVASAMMLTTMVIAPLTAGAGNYPDDKQATSSIFEFDKYLVLDSDAVVPNVTSTFSIAPGGVLADGVNGIVCYAGVGKPVFLADEDQKVTLSEGKAVVAFTNEDTTTPEASVGTKTVAFKTTDTADEKFAAKTITVSFAGIKFPEPGFYRYIITEEDPTDIGVSIADGHSNEYTLFVAVQDNDGTLEVVNKYIQEGTDVVLNDILDEQDNTTVIGKTNANKKTGMTNWYTTHDLAFSKTVEGNQGSKDKYFKFTIQLTNPAGENAPVMAAARANDRFLVSGSFEQVPEINAATNLDYKDVPTEPENNTATVMALANSALINVVVDETTTNTYVTYSQLAAGKVFYIHSGQNIEIKGIPDGLGYVITEVPEDYTPSAVVSSATGFDSNGVVSEAKNSVTDTALTADASVTFTNTKDGTIPTGVLTTVTASVGIVAIGLAGIIFGFVNNRKKSEEE